MSQEVKVIRHDLLQVENTNLLTLKFEELKVGWFTVRERFSSEVYYSVPEEIMEMDLSDKEILYLFNEFQEKRRAKIFPKLVPLLLSAIELTKEEIAAKVKADKACISCYFGTKVSSKKIFCSKKDELVEKQNWVKGCKDFRRR